MIFLDELDKKMREIFEIPNDVETKLWDAAKKDDYSELKINQSTVEYYGLQKNQVSGPILANCFRIFLFSWFYFKIVSRA